MKFTAFVLAAVLLGLNGSIMFGQTLTTLATFNGNNGEVPYSGLAADSAGNLYGTTFYGGVSGLGTVFRVDPGAHALTTFTSFNGTNGANPVNYGPLVSDGIGNFYGTTAGGGPTSAGTVFEISTASATLTSLASFDPSTTGYLPYGGLTIDLSGNLYGTTQFGGPGGGGVVFKIDGTTRSLGLLAAFSANTTGGHNPVSPPIIDSKGNLFGTTAGGGTGGGNGTIYEIDSTTHALTTVGTFNGDNGSQPNGIIFGPGGKLFGTTAEGGSSGGGGTVFEFDPATHTITTLASFAAGSVPESSVIFDTAGNLYGTAYYGGSAGLGAVFKIDLASNTETDLFSFDGANGAGPTCSLLMDASGNLYGTTTGGGFRAFGDGTVFELSLPEPAQALTLVIGSLALGLRRTRDYSE
jgi:uncharacterized repeat protein (TIGR03803 family)